MTAESTTEPIRGKRVLVVDDEPYVAQILAEIIALDDHHVRTVHDGLAALREVQERAYDLIVSDVRMPTLDGPGLYRELERCRPDLLGRFVFITGNALTPDVAEFLTRTGAPFLLKPCSPEIIHRVTQQVLRAGNVLDPWAPRG